LHLGVLPEKIQRRIGPGLPGAHRQLKSSLGVVGDLAADHSALSALRWWPCNVDRRELIAGPGPALDWCSLSHASVIVNIPTTITITIIVKGLCGRSIVGFCGHITPAAWWLWPCPS
jgi:hypothetical protein